MITSLFDQIILIASLIYLPILTIDLAKHDWDLEEYLFEKEEESKR